MVVVPDSDDFTVTDSALISMIDRVIGVISRV
jgi:hypothetical protein